VTKQSGIKLTATLALCRAVLPLLPGLDKHLQPHSPKTTAIFEAFTATYQKIYCCKAQQTKKHNVWGGILSFFYFF
jgi:hypothetical protein